MNPFLTKEICKHIFANFGIFKSLLPEISISTKSLNSDEYLLPDKLVFLDENDKDVMKNVWGCQISVGTQNFTVLLADMSVDVDDTYLLMVHLQHAPAYAVYLEKTDEYTVNSASINCSTDGNNWMVCTTYLETMFLAGLEQVKELGVSWRKAIDYSEDFDMLKTFIGFNDSLLGDDDEGQEG